MKACTIAIDVAKSVFEVAVSPQPGRVSRRLRLSRTRLPLFFAQQPPATVLLEACSSTHYWGRELQRLGHSVLLLPPHAVRKYRQGNKTDRADTKALLEAYRNDEIHPVPVKTVEQQTVAALHRLRSRWVATRTARLNTLRGLLREFGVVIPIGARCVLPRILPLLDDPEGPILPYLRPALRDACQEVRGIEQQISSVNKQLKTLAGQMPVVERLLTVPGIGLITATALVALVGDVHRFPSGRHFASYLGLTPREHSSGLTRRLGRISKRGDRYLRTLLIHGARSVLVSSKKLEQHDRLRSWALRIQAHRGHNVAAVALANKLARIAWAVWRQDDSFVSRLQEVETMTA
jgi:transposase